MKRIVIILVLAVLAVMTLPLWGSCELNANACKGWCSVRHFDSDVRTAACKARCATDRLQCLAEEGATEIEGIVEELQR